MRVSGLNWIYLDGVLRNIVAVTTNSRIKMLVGKLKQLSLKRLLSVQIWKQFGHWLFWHSSIKRKRVRQLVERLTLLDQDVPIEIVDLRNAVFGKVCLGLKPVELESLLECVNAVQQPRGFEQVFICSIYPQILRRGFGVFNISSDQPHRIDVEISYLGHNEDPFFWIFEVDGNSRDDPAKTLVPQKHIRGNKCYLVYRLGVASLVESGDLNPLQWMISCQTFFNNIMVDLKRRNYQVTAASISDFELGRLSLLRRLSLDKLKKHQSLYERQNR